VAFFVLLVGVFLAVAYSVAMGVLDNYRHYYQKSDLQWTGRNSRTKRTKVPFFKLLLLAFLIAWFLVHFLISP
jgi:hypothetical protein